MEDRRARVHPENIGKLPRWATSVAAGITSVLLAALLVPAQAAAEWTTPIDLSLAGGSSPQVAVDADGDAVVTWGAGSVVVARVRSADGTLSAVQTLSDPGHTGSFQVAVAPGGDALFVWRTFDGTNYRIQARARSADGTLSAVQTLSKGGQDAVQPQVAVAADGDALVTWYRSDGANQRVQARARSAAGVLSRVLNLSDPGQDAVLPQVAVDADGDALVAWSRDDGVNSRIQARARSAAGTLSGVQTLSDPGRHAFLPQVAINADGDAVFTWQRSEKGGYRIQARARSAGGALSGVQTLSTGGQEAWGPQVAVDADGDAVFTWRRYDGAHYRIQARARSAGGALSGVEALSKSGRDAFDPQVAVDADGNAVFTWRRFDGANDRVEARARSAAGTLRPITILSAPGGHAAGQQVAVDPDGDALVAWHRFDGTRYRIQASAGP